VPSVFVVGAIHPRFATLSDAAEQVILNTSLTVIAFKVLVPDSPTSPSQDRFAGDAVALQVEAPELDQVALGVTGLGPDAGVTLKDTTGGAATAADDSSMPNIIALIFIGTYLYYLLKG
jgi:hypothetical protein